MAHKTVELKYGRVSKLINIKHNIYSSPRFNDGTSDKTIDLYSAKPKMSIALLNGKTTVAVKTATLTLGNFKVLNNIFKA